MKSHEEFLKDIESDIARLNAALDEDNEDNAVLDEDDMQDEEVVPELVTSSQESSPGPAVGSHVEILDLDRAPSSRAPSSSAPSSSALSSAQAGEEMPELESLLKDHEALLLKIDSVLMNKGGEEEEEEDEYDQFKNTDDRPPSPSVLLHQNEEPEEDEEDDYFKGMNRFVDSEDVDIDKLYDVLALNLQYQDFVTKLMAEVERRLEKNRNKQKEISDEEDRMFLVSQGYLDSGKSTISKLLSLYRYRPPYFSNHYKVGPRRNPDQIRLGLNPRYQVYETESGWGKTDRTALLDCIRSTIVDERMTERMARHPDQEDAEHYHQELQNLDTERLVGMAGVEQWGDLQWQEVVLSLGAQSVKRALVDCRQQYVNYLSPKVSKDKWTVAEDKTLNKLVEKHGTNSWGIIASKLKTGRKAWQCLQRYKKTRKKATSPWNAAEDKHLTDAVMIYGDTSFSDLSYYMGDKTSDQCLQRWRYSVCPQIKRGKWTQEEDNQVMEIIGEHGVDWQKLKEIQKHRTRAQVKERIRILSAKTISGCTGSTKNWTAEKSFDLMRYIARHGHQNWAAIRKEFSLRYTTPVLFRRWVRLSTLINGTCKRIQLPWERTFMEELLGNKSKSRRRILTAELITELGDMLPSEEQKVQIREIVERSKISGGIYDNEFYKVQKRKLQDREDPLLEEEEEMPLSLAAGSSRPGAPAAVQHDQHDQHDELNNLLRFNAGRIYRSAFEVGSGSQFKMYYTPPSVNTVSAFRRLLLEQLPNLREQAGMQSVDSQPVSLPQEVLNSDEFKLLAARFKSLFSWPLIMGETPV